MSAPGVFASTKGHQDMREAPASTKTTERSGPKKCPMKMAAGPHFWKAWVPRATIPGCRSKGHPSSILAP